MIDRRSEFTAPMKVEADPETGEIPCRVLYCAPMNSNQKSNRSLGKQAEIVAFRISTNPPYSIIVSSIHQMHG